MILLLLSIRQSISNLLLRVTALSDHTPSDPKRERRQNLFVVHSNHSTQRIPPNQSTVILLQIGPFLLSIHFFSIKILLNMQQHRGVQRRGLHLDRRSTEFNLQIGASVVREP